MRERERINQRDIKPDKYFFLSKKKLSIQIILGEYL
jgi:hypothetical protein